MTNIETLKTILYLLTTYFGGAYPTYQNVDAIDASGTKFILVPVPEGNGSQNTYTVRKYKLQIKASSQANLETAIALIEKLGSDVYGSATKFPRTSYNHTFTCIEMRSYRSTDLWVNFVEESAVGYVKWEYINANDKWALACRFTSPTVVQFKDLTGLSITLPMNISYNYGYAGGKTTFFSFATLSPASFTGITSKTQFGLSTQSVEKEILVDLGGANTYECYNGTNYPIELTRADNAAFFAELDTLPDSTELILWLQPKAVFGTYRRYDAPSAITIIDSTDYPYWLTLKFEQDFSTQNQFYATFDVEARWAL